jgi:hypothetical protein
LPSGSGFTKVIESRYKSTTLVLRKLLKDMADQNKDLLTLTEIRKEKHKP